MRIDRLLLCLSQPRHLFVQAFVTGIFRVKSEPVINKRMHTAEFAVLIIQTLHILCRSVDAAAENQPDAGFNGGIRGCVRIKIHIKERRSSGFQIFQNRQTVKSVNVLLCQPVFIGEYLFKQPGLKRNILRKGAQERHRRMRVCILERRHQEIAVHIDLSLKNRLFVRLFPDQGDAAAVCPDCAFRDIKAVLHCQDFRIIKPYHAEFPFVII